MNEWPSGPSQYPISSKLVGDILRARVYDTAVRTPLDYAPRLSRRMNNQVFFKREDLQPVFSFKIRGAQNKLAGCTDATVAGGVICSSAGNHAQGVAMAARHRACRAVIVMPRTTPRIKIDAVRSLGGEVILEGVTYDDANAHALKIAEESGLHFIHPFDDPVVIAGQGTIAIELASQWQDVPSAVFVPIGGGGLIAGIGAYLKNIYPAIKIIGVESADAATMYRSLRHGAPVTLDRVGIFADGVAVRRVSDLTFALARETVDEIILVDTDEMCAAIKDIFEDSRAITEPAGALAVAGLKRYLEQNDIQRKTFIAVNSGANMNFDRLRHVSERAEIGEHREAVLAVEIPERPGAFLEFAEQLGERSVTEFNYRFAPTMNAHIFVGLSVDDARQDIAFLLRQLELRGYRALDLSANELAKLHIRHMIGGRAVDLDNEQLFRFEFPEQPGALRNFLAAIGGRWNITLFHYRNHGSGYGRVLAGIQVPEAERSEFQRHLDQLGYGNWQESENPAYRLFLK